MNDIIRLLPDHVANQIAAGEVVQRPASVVKELLENSIDAKASTISLIVKDAGKTLIQVVDDGVGMTETDARMAFERHATSKIQSAEDLFNLHTKGFRGEALASIAAVSHVELKSKRADSDTGTKLVIEGSEVKSQDPCVISQGSSISVKNLFFNIPARRNFLKSNNVEQRHIIDEFQRVALAHPQIAFKLIHNGNELFRLPPTKFRQRIVNVIGRKIDDNLVPVLEETELLKVEGFVAKPTFAKRTRGEQFFYVNNRFIKNSYLHHAVGQSFEGLLKPKTHPSYFINFTIDPKTIDINIHPTKTEIKFEDEYSIYSILRSTVKHSLGQFNIAPVLDFDRDKSMDPHYDAFKNSAKLPKVEVDRNFNPFKDANSSPHQHKNTKSSGWQELYPKEGQGVFNQPEISFESLYNSSSLFNESTNEFESFQFLNKYIVTSRPEGVLIINQNRAHQRVLYEQFLKQITQEAASSQQLMFPLVLELSNKEVGLLNSLRDSLELTGFMFDFSKAEKGSVLINGIPNILIESQIEGVLLELLEDFKNEVPSSGFDRNNRLSIIMSKNMAFPNGKVLKTEEQSDLIKALYSCKEPLLSPENRPIFVELDDKLIEKLFHT